MHMYYRKNKLRMIVAAVLRAKAKLRGIQI